MGAENVQTVQGIYEAFGRGDVPAILDVLSEDVRWEEWAENLAQHAGVPWLKPRRGKQGVAEFFEVVGAFKIHEFSVLDIIGGERQVAVEIVIEADVPSGGHFRDEELHLWTFDDDAKVVRMRHHVDTAKHKAAAYPAADSAEVGAGAG